MTAARKSGPARTRPWDAILDRWVTGGSVRGIAAALGIPTSAVRHVVHVSRQRGDARAVRRRAPNGQAGTGHMIAGAWGPYWTHPAQPALPFGGTAAQP